MPVRPGCVRATRGREGALHYGVAMTRLTVATTPAPATGGTAEERAITHKTGSAVAAAPK